ncbi:MAG TPA: alpha/beta hydrolase-fold protein [Pyrinomonadaceae bacterium]|nr:alpha/beta hydrolase-fold protein [Pyrinomonadaceae bacterium]
MRASLPLIHLFSPLSRHFRSIQFLVFGIIAVMSAATAATAQGPVPGVPNINQFTIKSNVLGEDRRILVRTPANYDTNKATYPVMYMTDGDAHIAHTSGSIDFLARQGRMSELILVGIPNTDRTRDLSPSKPSTTGATGAPQFPTAGGADKFLQFIETELIPEINKRYRVTPYKILAGHSLGGMFAVHTMVTRPDLFNSYIAVSPALQWDNQLVVKRAEEFFKNRKEFDATFFMTIANEPGPLEDAFHQFKQLLSKNQTTGFVWDAQEMPDEDHGTVVLRSHYFGLRKVYDGWQMPRDPMTGAIAGGLKAADEHYAKLSKKFGYQLQVPEVMVNQIGYQHLFADEVDKAIEVLKIQVERYPESANPYDSLGEAYERSGKLDLAVPMYEKAAAIGKKNNDANAALFQTNYQRAADKLKADTAKKAAADPAKKTQ